MASFVVVEDSISTGAWKFMILKAVILAVLGIFCLVFPFATMNLSAYLLAFFLLIVSIVALFSGFAAFGYFKRNWLMVILGIIGIALAIYSFINPQFMVAFATIFIGIIALLSGLSDIILAFGKGLSTGIRILTFILGLVSVAVGIFFLVNPGIGAGILVIVIGVALLINAVISLVEGIIFKKDLKKLSA
jgi:uncharacterized membrane protein HdeD (DUF308 family)